MFSPKSPFNVAFKLLKPIEIKKSGVVTKYYDEVNAPLFFGSFKTFGGTENKRNDIYTMVDTGTINTWYRPDITADCVVERCDNQKRFEIISEPENIDMRNQYLQFKVRALGGKT